MSGVDLKSVTKLFGGSPAVDRLDLTINEGEFFVLLGPSGCGKTTTLRCIAGLEEPDSGVLAVGGRTMAHPEHGIFVPPHKRGLGMVFQSYGLWPHMSVYGNVTYPLRARRVPRSGFASAVSEALELVGLSGLEHRFPNELSGGQQQRVALARAIVTRPTLLLFDEPLSNLDAQLRNRLRADLKRIHRERNCTAVYVTHDQSEAFALADRLAIMRAGRIEQMGSPAEIFRTPASQFVAEFVGYDNFVPAIVRNTGDGFVTAWSDALNQDLTGRANTAVTVGSKVWIMVRSGDVQLARLASAESKMNVTSGVITDATYLGDRFQCAVSIGATTLLGTLEQEASPFGPGDSQIAPNHPVSILIEFRDLLILPRSEGEVARSALVEIRNAS